ncbi:helix-turn-helix domain-containing protein [Streptomyces sp.]|uniref:PucR family transcriptional regulator n=1 Tax=Streptomyces sp. TaxID=1931 RepID=UPI002D77D778|nr:helix-turn-helix domain-containing protein [Streptomyces sp.]HET6352827.1 helix-turn-helix domain-containing protein [Streptomyces sp.]
MTEEYAQLSLKGILALFEPYEARLLTPESQADVQVTAHAVLDLTEQAGPLHRGALLIAVGISPADTALLDALPALADAGVAAIALKTRGSRAEPLVETATAAGVVVVDIAEEIPWRHVDALLGAAMGEVRHGAPSSLSADTVGDLAALADVVAAWVGGAVTIEDPQRRVLAYSNLPGQPIDDLRREAILRRQAPDDFLQACRRVQVTEGVIRIDDLSPLPRLAVAVRAGTDLLGSIWAVQSPGTTFSPETERVLCMAAQSAALQLLRLRRATHRERQARGELLRSLMAGELESSPPARLGIERGRMTVLAFWLPSSPETPADVVGLQAADLVAACAESMAPRSSCVVEGDVVYALLPLPDELPEAHGAVALARTVLDRAEASLRIRLRAGIGSAVTHLTEVPRSRQDADRVLSVLTTGHHGCRIASIEDVRCQAILLELGDTAVRDPRLRLGSVAAILRHDTEKRAEYAKSLLTYLEEFGDIAVAADRLHVHQNTLRYRLRRITELFGVNLSDADERLVLWLQLRHLCRARHQKKRHAC